MTWVAVGLVAAIILGAAVYFFLIRWMLMARHGRLAIPCDEVVELPAGEHMIHYEDAKRWRYSEAPQVAAGFSVVVAEAESGRRVDLAEPPSPTPTKTSGKSRIPYALLVLPEPGSYRITARVGAGAERPHLTIG
jgi:hypothetical protein